MVRDVDRGRPLFLTARRFIKVCKWIEQGESFSEACRLELVHYTGFRRHVRLNPKYQRRLKEAEGTREEFLREYHIAHTFGNTRRGTCWRLCGGSSAGIQTNSLCGA